MSDESSNTSDREELGDRLIDAGLCEILGGQAPLMQSLMSPYLEQSRALFDRLQEQLQKGGMFPGVPGFPPHPGVE